MNAEQIANSLDYERLTKMEAVAFAALGRAYERMVHWENTPIYATNVAEYRRIERRWRKISEELSAMDTIINGAVDRGEM